MSYPQDLYRQQTKIAQWRDLIAKTQDYDKPFMQPLYLILQKDDDFKPLLIHLGFRIGVNYLIDYLQNLEDIGVNHIALNLRFNSMNMNRTLEYLAEKVLPHFHKSPRKQKVL